MKIINRLDPEELTQDDFRDVENALSAMFPSAALVNDAGVRLELPQPIFEMLMNILRRMQERKSIVMIPLSEVCTTQGAADYLGVSRPFFVSLLTKGEIAYHQVGSHKRVTMKDLVDYESKRDKNRKERLDRLSSVVRDAGLDDTSPFDE